MIASRQNNGQNVQSFRRFNEETGEFFKDGKTVKFRGEAYWRERDSYDLYNFIMGWIKDRQDLSPEHATICKILRDRGQTEFLYSLLVNI